MSNDKLKVILVTVLSLVLGASFAQAADRGERRDNARKAELQREFKQRLAALDELKADGKIGETQEGYVDAVEDRKLTEKAERLVREENRDRKELYKIIADEENTTVDHVASRNAERNYRNLQRGEWFRGKNGRWRQK